jgi:sulfatase maturation enzyme AslB (radical SAM superfamily)
VNVLVTSKCNRRCPYCFAASRISYGETAGAPAREAPRNISREDFRKAVEFTKTGGIPLLGILGGEPSLHPEFVGLLDDAMQQKLEAKVFTNGVWRERDVEAVKERAKDESYRLRLVVNVNHPDITPEPERRAQERLFRALGPRCTLSYNIYQPEPDMLFLADVIREHKMTRNIRLGLAQPLADGESSHVSVAEYARVAPHIVALARRCDEHDITIGFDCGFTLCMFTPEQLGQLQLCGSVVRASCGPAVDVGTDLSVWACFPLATLERGARLSDFADMRALTTYFDDRFRRLYRTGAMDACVECRYLRRGQCSGGCAAHVYRSLNP